MLEKVMRGSPAYWAWLVFLTALSGLGVAIFVWQMVTGAEYTALSRDVAWGFFIANYTFMVGVAASAVMVVIPYYLHNQKEFGKIIALGEFLAVGAILTVLLFITVDIGQPGRMFNILLHPTPNSPFFWNTIVLPGYALLNLVIAWFTLDAQARGLPMPRWIWWLILLSIPWAISIHTMTSFVYSGLVARPFWNSAVLTPRFLSSAFASGPALLILLGLAVRRFAKFDPGLSALGKLSLIVAYAMIINLFLILVEVFVVFYGQIPGHTEHFQYLYFGLDGHGVLVPWMWASAILGVAGVGLLINPDVRRNPTWLGIACAAVYLSTWIDKGLGLVVGGFCPSPLEHITEYFPTIGEFVMAAAIYALALLVITLLYKIAIATKEELAA